MAFILVALREKRELGLLNNYVRYAEGLLSQGAESIYALGWGVNISFVHEVAAAIKEKEKNFTEINRIPYKSVFSDGGAIDALCILFRNMSIAELQDTISSKASEITRY